jgi:ribonucleotide monophosphatase NagD (HAD superfamily)
LVQVTVDGASLITMPGTLAKFYQQQGGAVQLMGKPDPIIYTAAQELLPAGAASAAADPQQWLAIGDSLEHDVAGCVAQHMFSNQLCRTQQQLTAAQ